MRIASRINDGTVAVAAIDQLLTGWIHWENAKPVEHRMVLVASGQYPPRRHELGDVDPANWEADSRGSRATRGSIPPICRCSARTEICTRSARRAAAGMVRSAN